MALKRANIQLANMGNDVDESLFNENDAPALFPDGVDIVTLGKYLDSNSLGEVSLHGSSKHTLWNSNQLEGSFLDSIYSSYVEGGGQKSLSDFRNDILCQLQETDCAQGAPYVDYAKRIIEDEMGFPIKTVGIWGGNPSVTVDNITISLNKIKGAAELNWKNKGFTAICCSIGDYRNFKDVYHISRGTYGTSSENISEIEKIDSDKAYEIFWHFPFNDIGIKELRILFDYIAELEKNGEAEVVTRAQYAELGEYVSNPIVSLSIGRNSNIKLNEEDVDSEYVVEVQYKDGTREKLQNEVIIDRSGVDCHNVGNYTVKASFRGFSATCEVSVIPSIETVPEELKQASNWFIYNNLTNGNMYCGTISGAVNKANLSNGKLLFSCTTSGKINGWKSVDGGNSWEKVTDNVTSYKTIKTDGSAGGFSFDTKAKDEIAVIDSTFSFLLN